MRSGYEWDLEGGGAFYEARYGIGWDFVVLRMLTFQNLLYASTILHPRTYASR